MQTKRSVAHGSFTVTRTYAAPTARVFAAWSQPQIKGKWYGDPEKVSEAEIFEFRPGGLERRRGVISDGTTYTLEHRYHDVIENERIIYAYEVIINGARTSVSIATVEFTPVDAGTKLTVTEHGAFLDGLDDPQERRGGAEFVLDRLAEILDTGTGH